MKTKTQTILEERYPNLKVFDCALPQGWVNEMSEKGIDVRNRVVWGYFQDGSIFGEPLALDDEMEAILNEQ